jgi:hypothetical protein
MWEIVFPVHISSILYGELVLGVGLFWSLSPYLPPTTTTTTTTSTCKLADSATILHCSLNCGGKKALLPVQIVGNSTNNRKFISIIQFQKIVASKVFFLNLETNLIIWPWNHLTSRTKTSLALNPKPTNPNSSSKKKTPT